MEFSQDPLAMESKRIDPTTNLVVFSKELLMTMLVLKKVMLLHLFVWLVFFCVSNAIFSLVVFVDCRDLPQLYFS